MFKNYFKIAYRSIKKKAYSVINTLDESLKWVIE